MPATTHHRFVESDILWMEAWATITGYATSFHPIGDDDGEVVFVRKHPGKTAFWYILAGKSGVTIERHDGRGDHTTAADTAPGLKEALLTIRELTAKQEVAAGALAAHPTTAEAVAMAAAREAAREARAGEAGRKWN